MLAIIRIYFYQSLIDKINYSLISLIRERIRTLLILKLIIHKTLERDDEVLELEQYRLELQGLKSNLDEMRASL